ncbi:hypothetical protein EDB86DRAFT_2826778 [Lactarius hatsudake]|nr:hypothetical protein EDB86DRAFT_2826778 [Lactarius hatsudake]
MSLSAPAPAWCTQREKGAECQHKPVRDVDYVGTNTGVDCGWRKEASDVMPGGDRKARRSTILVDELRETQIATDALAYSWCTPYGPRNDLRFPWVELRQNRKRLPACSRWSHTHLLRVLINLAFMTPLPPFPYPLEDQPPDGYGREECALSTLSTTTAFEVSIRERDRFLGRMRCVICGIVGSTLLQYCHIIGQAEPRRTCTHEIQTQRFVLVNYSGIPELQTFHGKAVALDNRDHHAPFPSLFLIHEMRVRGLHPFVPTSPEVPENSPFQDWILLDGVYDNISRSFKRDNSNGDVSGA